jgi:AraC family transcriptional regulator of adaptative response/methylated-DNA-[protein]-cysteine methyltransferase
MAMRLDSPISEVAISGPGAAAWGGDYGLVRRVIDGLTVQNSEPPDLDRIAGELGITVAHMQRVVQRWCGLPFGEFVRALGRGYVQSQLADAGNFLEGSTSSGRPPHAFDIRIAATISEDAQRRGAGLDVIYGFHECPFGLALVTVAGGGVCGLAFIDDDGEANRKVALDDMIGRWPRAVFREAPEDTGVVGARIFAASGTGRRDVVPVTLIGTPFDIRVWQTLLAIPMGRLISYTDIARHLGQPTASRAVGTANGRNPISFIVPCHRALRGDGTLGGYYWGLTRKWALIAWEAGRLMATRESHARRLSARARM